MSILFSLIIKGKVWTTYPESLRPRERENVLIAVFYENVVLNFNLLT